MRHNMYYVLSTVVNDADSTEPQVRLQMDIATQSRDKARKMFEKNIVDAELEGFRYNESTYTISSEYCFCQMMYKDGRENVLYCTKMFKA